MRKGEIVMKDEESAYSQRTLLEAEGVFFLANGLVDLEKSRYEPEISEEDLI